MTDHGERLLMRLPGRSAEEAVRAASSAPGAAGFAVGVDLLAGPGAAAVGALSRLGRVLVLWAIHGSASDVAAAVARLAGFGPSWIAVHAVSGEEALGAAVEAARGSSAEIVAATLDPAVDDARATALGLGASRGRMVSRLAARARDAGASGVLCALGDVVVVEQAAPGLGRIVVGVESPTEATAALERGAELVVVPPDVFAALRSPGPSG